MIKYLSNYLIYKKIKTKINLILNLFYSKGIFDIDIIMNKLNPKGDVEVIDCLIYINFCTDLIEPFSKHYISEIINESKILYDNCCQSQKIKDLSIQVLKSETKLKLKKIEWDLSIKKQAFENNKNDLNALIYKKMTELGRPLSVDERRLIRNSI